MEVVDKELSGNIDSVTNTLSSGYRTMLGSARDESYYNLQIRDISSSVSPEERDGAIGCHNPEGPYEVPGTTNMVHNQGEPYQELRYYENTVVRYTQEGPYEIVNVNSPHPAATVDSRDTCRNSRPSTSDNSQYLNLPIPRKD